MALSCDVCRRQDSNTNQVRKTRFAFERPPLASGAAAPGLPGESAELDVCDECFAVGKPIARDSFQAALNMVRRELQAAGMANPPTPTVAETPKSPVPVEEKEAVPEPTVEEVGPSRLTATEAIAELETSDGGASE